MKSKDKTNVKVKNFFKKVDPISFALVVLLGASATFAAFQLAGNGGVATPVINQGIGDTDDTALVGLSNPEWLEEAVIYPIDSETVAVTTTFFNVEADSYDEVVDSVFLFQVGNRLFGEQSLGTSFRDYDNEVVNVVSVLSGVVSEIQHDELTRGMILTIDHENGAQSVFTGLYDVTVEVGDQVDQGAVLGLTGLSLLEPDSGNVVHFEFIHNGVHVNPENIIGTLLGDL